MNTITTLGQFIIQKQDDSTFAKGGLSRLLRDISIAAKIVSTAVNRGELMDMPGDQGNVHVQLEKAKKLDLYARAQFIAALKSGQECCMVISKGHDDALALNTHLAKQGKFIVALNPLDGFSDIDESVGTIFSIYRREETNTPVIVDEIFQKEIPHVAAGYVIYGSSTMLVYSTGKGVNGFTLDPSFGEFCLSHPDMKTPENSDIYSINEGDYEYFSNGILSYVEYCKQIDPSTSRPYVLRYTGSIVADFHRNLIKGGIFICPGSRNNPHGKLQLLYECNPLAFLIEQAGGIASDGESRILDVCLTKLHQRSRIFIGSSNMVSKALEFHRNANTK